MIHEGTKAKNSPHWHKYAPNLSLDSWLWCYDCNRAFPLGESILREHPSTGTLTLLCPFCSGADLWDWQKLRKLNPEYPAVPKYGDMFPFRKE